MKWKQLLCYIHWTPQIWQEYPSLQIPEYGDRNHLEEIKTTIRQKNPLVFAGEVETLKSQLRMAEQGKQFIFQAGPCMEEIRDNQIQEIKNLFTLIVQSSLVLGFGLEKKIIRIGRIAGQYAKPRSDLYEKDGSYTYRGDIIHSLEDRTPNPHRMLEAYYHSLSTLNAIRSFAKSGDLDLNQIEYWKYPNQEPFYLYQYQKLQETLKKSVKFIQNCGKHENDSLLREPDFYISHEALLLHYEEALTRKDSKSHKYYNCAAHSVWLGERTRKSQAHIEYLKGIENPIGIKIGSSIDGKELIQLIKTLNPNNESGKIMLIFRIGVEKLYSKLSSLIKEIQSEQLNVLYLCDPCHANTKKINNIKTRYISTIQNEILNFFDICYRHQIIPGGIHLEISGENVTECIGLNVKFDDLKMNYQSLIDPRLNNLQTLDTAFFISSIENKLYK